MAEGDCFPDVPVRRGSMHETLVTREEYGAACLVVMYTGASRQRPAWPMNANPPSEARVALLRRLHDYGESLMPDHIGLSVGCSGGRSVFEGKNRTHSTG